MSCSNCGNNCGGTCKVCRENPCKSCCKQPCLRWGFDGCYLRGRCADGAELTPLNLCEWLKVHETCTSFRLVPRTTENDSYMEYLNECGESYKMYVCDFLSLGRSDCLADIQYDNDGPQSCDLMVFDPCCGSACGVQNKWTNYHIPDAGNCVVQADADGYFHVLTKNDCGCIVECKLFATGKCWEYSLRDSWPDDPDWPFTMGSRTGNNSEIIDLQLDTKCPMFGATDLKVTVQYGYGIQNTGDSSASGHISGDHNFKSIVTPTTSATHTPNVTDILSKAIVVQGTNTCPWGSWEWQVSRTFIVPKGQKLYLNHVIEERDINGNLMPFNGESSTPTEDSSRLHALHVFVEPTKGTQV